MINLRHIEVFHAIMHTGSITGAAQMLCVTQPAVSAMLKNFETRVGMRLFAREGGRLQATPEAQALLPDIQEIFGRLQALDGLARDLAGGSRGTLAVAATSPIANGYLAEAVAQFVHTRPHIKVAVHALASPQVLDRVVSGEVDLGIAFEPPSSGVVSAEVLTNASIACVLPEAHPLAARRSLSLHDLAPYPLITYLPQAVLRPTIDRLVQETGVSLKISIEVGLSITGMVLAYHGAGIALVEPSLLPSLPLPGLVSRPLAPRVAMRSLLLTHKLMPRSRVAQEFIAQLQAHLACKAAAHNETLWEPTES